jgi:hypothetical protein
MTEVGARDRLVMAGLVVLGLFTVVAGVDDFTLVEDLGRLTAGWALSQIHQSQNEVVSKLAVGADLSPAALEGMLVQDGSRTSLAQSVTDDAVGLLLRQTRS